MPITRRTVQRVLGVLWLLDGALQLQPYMFTTGFARGVINPAADGQPRVVAGPVHWAADLIAAAPAVLDVLFAATQLALGAGLLLAPTRRPALFASIPWALSVWLLGEGLGGLASGHTSLITGAPGAVVLYALCALLALPERTRTPAGPLWRDDIPPPTWAGYAWAVLWIGAAALGALPGNDPLSAISTAAQTAPSTLAPLDHTLVDHLAGARTALTVAATAITALIGAAGLAPRPWRTAAAWAGAVIAAACWVLGQNLGQLYTGQATDPNAAPLIVLLAAILTAAPTPARPGTPRGVEAGEAPRGEALSRQERAHDTLGYGHDGNSR